MAAYTKTLYDSTGANILYPQTLAQIVYTQNNETVEDVLNTKLTTPSGNQGQFLGFVANNTIGAVDAPTSTSLYDTQYSGSLSSSSWTSSNGQYYAQVTLSGMTSTQLPLVFPQWTTNITNEQSSWNLLTGIESFNGYVRFYANAPFSTTVNYNLIYSS